MESASDVFMNVSPVDLSEDEINPFLSPIRGTSPSRRQNPPPPPMANQIPPTAGSQQPAVNNSMSANTIPWQKVIRLNNFDGRSRNAEAVDEWIEKIELFSEVCNASEVARLRLAVAYLQGAARLWWKSLREGDRPTTWMNFTERLRRQFRPPNYAQALRDQLHRCRQTKSVADYADRFRSLINQIPDLSEGDSIDRFVRGLKPRVSQTLRLHTFDTLDEYVEMADKIDRTIYSYAGAESFRPFREMSRPVGTPMELGNLTMIPEESEEEQTEEHVEDEDLVEEATERVRMAEEELENAKMMHAHAIQVSRTSGSRRKFSHHSNSSFRSHQRTGNSSSNDRTCWECHKPGHYRHQCPEWKKKQGNE
jgi:hypothetical protein